MGHSKDILSAKLSVLMDEFDKLMKEHDLGGAIILHHKNEVAYKLFMTPDYSIAEEVKDVDGNSIAYRFKNKGLTPELKKQKTEETCNLFRLVSTIMMDRGYMLATISEDLDSTVGAEYSEPDN